MKFFVTGATGYVGRALVRKLIREGHTVHALYRTPSKAAILNHPRIHSFQGDLLYPKSLEKAMSGCIAVFHSAAKTDMWSQNPNLFYQINVLGTRNVMDCASRLGADKVVVTSTAGVYGPSSFPMDESRGFSSSFFSVYEKTKAAADRTAVHYTQKGMKVVLVHPTRIYGPGPLSQSNSVTRMIKYYLEGKWRFMLNNGRARGNYVYIDDVVDGHISAMQRGCSGESYIIGGENASYEKFFSTLEAVSGKKRTLMGIPAKGILLLSLLQLSLAENFKISPAITPAMVRKLSTDWVISHKKAEKELGYFPLSLREGLRNTLDWIKSSQEE